MVSAGRILIMPKGNYDSSVTYEMLDMVSHNGTTWVAKKTVKGIEPSAANSEHWHNMFDLDIANDLTTETEGKVLDARQGKVLNDTKQERRTQSVTVGANSSYTHTMAYRESGFLFAYADGMEYAAIFACCGVNESAFSIVKLNEKAYADIFSSEVGTIGGVDVNKITFTNNTDNDRPLTFIMIPFE